MNLEKKHWIHFTFSIFFMMLFFYCIGWFFLYHRMEDKLEDFVIDASREGLIFEEGTPVMGGFPLTPSVKFIGTINYNGVRILIPEMTVSSFLVAGSPFKVSIPYGLALARPFNPEIFSLDSFSMKLNTPALVPAKLTEQHLMQWKRRVGSLKIKSIQARKGSVKFQADGTIGLDMKLQPTIKLETKTRGHQEVIALFEDAGVLKKGETGLISAALRGLSQKDPITGEDVLSIPITLENQQLFLGPVQVARLPVFVWDTRRLPDQPRRQHDGLRAFQKKFDKDTPRPPYE